MKEETQCLKRLGGDAALSRLSGYHSFYMDSNDPGSLPGSDSPLNERKGSDAEMLFNGKMSPFGGGRVGAPTVNSYDVPRFCARAHVFESCKVCVAACFGAC